jgi:hypothetical protein
MAPTESAVPINVRTIAIAVLVVAVVVWLVLSNMPPAPKEQPKVIKVNATPPAPPPQQQEKPQPVVNMFMCRGEAYKTRSGVTICGVEMVTEQYIFVRRGWIYAPNSTQIMIVGDVSACRFSIGVNTLYLNCTSPIMVAR